MKKVEDMNPVEFFEYVTSLINSSANINEHERRELFDAALVQLLANVEII